MSNKNEFVDLIDEGYKSKDRKAIKLAAENYPDSEFYETSKVLTELGIGEALVSALNEKGVPTPLVKTMLRAPMSMMEILNKKIRSAQ